MHTRSFIQAVAAGLLLLAANSSFAQGNINSGTTRLDFVGAPFAASSGNANLSFGGTFNGTDMVNMIGWAYNQGSATQTRPFSSLDTPLASYVGDTATFTWANAGSGTAGFARFDAVMTVRLTQVTPGTANNPGAALVSTNLNFKASANNAAAIPFSVFHHLNLDLFGTNANAAPDDVYTVQNASGIQVRSTDSTSAANHAEMLATGAQFYELGNGSALRTKLGLQSGSAGFANLSTAAGVTAAPFAGADGSAAFQWTQSLAPGASMNVQTSFTVNAPVPEPGTWVLLALGLGVVASAAQRRKAG